MNKILIIDDEVDFCYFVRANLELTGEYEVQFANKGEEGIKLAVKYQPDLILLDVMMPGISGFEVLEKLKKNKATFGIPVVFLTAKIDTESKQQAASLYGHAYIEKPVETMVLREKIEQTLSLFRTKSKGNR